MFGMGTGVTLAVLPPETFARCGDPVYCGPHAASVTTDFGWHYKFDSKSNALCIFWLAASYEAAVLLFPKDGLGKFYD